MPGSASPRDSRLAGCAPGGLAAAAAGGPREPSTQRRGECSSHCCTGGGRRSSDCSNGPWGVCSQQAATAAAGGGGRTRSHRAGLPARGEQLQRISCPAKVWGYVHSSCIAPLFDSMLARCLSSETPPISPSIFPAGDPPLRHFGGPGSPDLSLCRRRLCHRRRPVRQQLRGRSGGARRGGGHGSRCWAGAARLPGPRAPRQRGHAQQQEHAIQEQPAELHGQVCPHRDQIHAAGGAAAGRLRRPGGGCRRRSSNLLLGRRRLLSGTSCSRRAHRRLQPATAAQEPHPKAAAGQANSGGAAAEGRAVCRGGGGAGRGWRRAGGCGAAAAAAAGQAHRQRGGKHRGGPLSCLAGTAPAAPTVVVFAQGITWRCAEHSACYVCCLLLCFLQHQRAFCLERRKSCRLPQAAGPPWTAAPLGTCPSATGRSPRLVRVPASVW